MLVVDDKCSEHGLQRRKSSSGRQLHCCCICGRLDVWSDSWSCYCSVKEEDDGTPYPKFCSENCRQQGGPRAKNVTVEMKQRAKDAEWREPEIAWREETDREKYNRVAFDQTRQRNRPKLDSF